MPRPTAAIALVLAVTLSACNGGSSGPATGSLTITVAGLPTTPAVPAAITVTGVGGYTHAVTATTTLNGLAVGSYTVAAASASTSTETYTASPASNVVNVTTSGGTSSVTYALASGGMALTISGLPGGQAANVLVTGQGDSQVVTATQVLVKLLAGDYTITGNTVVNGTTTFGGTPFSQTIAVPASLTPVNAAVAYSAMTGQIPVTVSGLPGGSNPSILVTGPFAYSHAITANGLTTLTSLPLGDYTVTADSVPVGPAYYFAEPPGQTATLNGGTLNAPVAVTYGTPDMSIDGMYITQATQSYTGTVPLIASRSGFLRVFVKANHANTWMPKVRVRWYASGVLVRTDTIPAPTSSVPTTIIEGLLNSSWNLPVPKALIQPGLSVLADVDPSNAIAEGNETNNFFPVNGTALTLDVRTASPAYVTLVPVKTPDGLTGMVNSANADSFLTFTQRIHPIPSHFVTLHAMYTTSSGPLQSDDGNQAWDAIIAELDALRTADGATPEEHYYGVVDPPYAGGVAGLGYIGGQTAMGWDKGINDQILAHEIGHNWNRYHSPCGSPAQVDPNYPYFGGVIGVYGFDVATQTLYAPTIYDVMSYCHPYWISDYTYKGVMAYRVANPDVVAEAKEPVLLVWGHMRGDQMVLEPAFEIMARPRVPTGGGAYSVEAFDAGGGRLFSYGFDGQEVADAPGGARTFVFAIPVSRFDISRLASMRLSGRGRVVSVSAAAPAPTGLMARLRARGRAEVRWDRSAYPMALVRDAATGQVLSFARGGVVNLGARATNLIVTVSNGVRSTTEAVTAQ